MSDMYREQILKQKMLNDMYKKEREKEGIVDLKSDEKEKQQSLIKKMEKKPLRLEGETDEDYQTRLDQWEARVGIKVKEDMAKERDKLLKNFQRIMSPSEAGEMMSSPQITEENIRKLNQHWKSFEEALRKKYSSLDFDILEEFILKYIDTVDVDDNFRALSKNIKEVDENLKRFYLIIRDRLDDMTDTLDENASELKKLMKESINKNNTNLFKVYNLLSDLIKNKTDYTIEQIEAKTTEIISNINQARRATDTQTRNVLDSIKDALDTIQNDISTSEANISRDISETRDILRLDIDNQIDRAVRNQAKILDRVGRVDRMEPTILEEKTITSSNEKELDSVNKRQRELEKELEIAGQSTFEYEPDVTTSPSPLKTNMSKLYTIDEITNHFRSRPQLYESVRGKLNTKNGKEDMLVRAREYSKIIPQGGLFLKRFEDKIYEQDNPFLITDTDIERYIIPLIAYQRNSYLENNPRVKANDRTKNASTSNSRAIFGAGNTVLNTVSPNKIIVGRGLEKQKQELNLIPFGRYEIDLDRLDEKNLLITYHNSSMNRVKYFPQKIVSDELKNLIYYVSSKKKYNDKLFNMLDDDEKLLFKNMFIKSGLSKMLNVKIFDDETKQAKKDYDMLKETYYIIEGQINAGNDNPLLVKELNDITKQLKKQIVYMNKIGLIGLKESNNLILSL